MADENGKPMHSWRVLVLPFLGLGDLYDRYKFDEPWDGPNNRKLAAEMPHTYRCPAGSQDTLNTSWVGIIGQNTFFRGAKATRMQDITDGTSHTACAVEVADSGIHWMEPRDIQLSDLQLRVNASSSHSISSSHQGCAHVALASHEQLTLTDDTPGEVVRRLLIRNDGKSIGKLGDR